ncbi:hypothetical protein AAHA92_03188 [Salvia divinorum]|uniref:Uncharacterized protein n=1 Tax=Salvia divinorum TaxID=28513 RepID=A0ABD1IG92_SALDI
MNLGLLASPAKAARKVWASLFFNKVKKEVLPKVEKEDGIDEAKTEHLLRRLHETSSGRPKPVKIFYADYCFILIVFLIPPQLPQVAFGVGEASTFKLYHPSNDTSSYGKSLERWEKNIKKCGITTRIIK